MPAPDTILEFQEMIRAIPDRQVSFWRAVRQSITTSARDPAALLIGLFNGVLFGFVFSVLNGFDDIKVVGFSFGVSFCYAAGITFLAMAPWRVKLWRTRPLPPPALVLANGSLSALMGVTLFTLSMLIPVVAMWGWDGAVRWSRSMWPHAVWGLIYSVVGFYMVIDYTLTQRQKEREAELKRLADESQLAALRSQMNPHFFFNALNTIAALIPERPAVAEQAIESLAAAMRPALRSGQPPLAPLSDEIRLARAYAGIERLRFGDRLSIIFDVSDEAAGCAVPSFSIQPLVENAITHGAAKTSHLFEITVAAACDGPTLTVTIHGGAPDAPGNQTRMGETVSAPLPDGHALANLSRRLEVLFGREVAMEVRLAADHTSMVTITLPRRILDSSAPVKPAALDPAADSEI